MKNKGFIHVIFLVIVVAALSIVGVFFLLKPQPPTTPTPTPVATQTPDPFEGWKTYINTELGYKISYPSDWGLKEYAGSVNIIPPEHVDKQYIEGAPDYIRIYNGDKINYKLENAETYAIDIYDATEGKVVQSKSDDPSFLRYVLISSGNSASNLKIVFSSAGSIERTIFSQILSTFEFSQKNDLNNNDLEERVAKMFVSEKGDPADSKQELLVQDVQIKGDWAMGTIIVTALPGGGPAVWRFMASNVSGSWVPAMEYTPLYLEWFRANGSQFFENKEAYLFLRDKHYITPNE